MRKVMSSNRSPLFLLVLFLALFAGSASYSQTESHPFILYTPDEISVITGRLGEEPYSSWMDEAVQIADEVLGLGVVWNDVSAAKNTLGYYAKMLAFAFAFTDELSPNHRLYGDEAARALSNIPASSYKNKFTSDLDVSEAVMFWAAAYDMLKGADFDFLVDSAYLDPGIRTKFKDIRDYMARDVDELFFNRPSLGWDFPSVAYLSAERTDNHHVKMYASLAVLSLAIYDESGSVNDFSRALERLALVLDNMTITGDNGEEAGGWAEGPRYHQYSAHEYIPALAALRNKGITDFDNLPELDETHLWLPRIVMPDGYTPPIDDNEAIVFDMAGLLYSQDADLAGRDALAWMWENGARKINNAFLPDYIARFDDTLPVYSGPDELGWSPTDFFPESGFARFRSSWDSDALYLLLLSEHGEARSNGQAHEHPDPNSFILHAYGEMLMLDSGYGGWTEHENTRFAENHNLILIDGVGPEGASQGPVSSYWNAGPDDANLRKYFTSGSMDYAVSETIYLNTDFKRHILFPSHRYFIMYDRAAGAVEHSYTLLLHGNGGEDSGGTFTLVDSGALWERDNASIRSFTVSTSELFTEIEPMKHAVYGRTPMLSHTVLKQTQTGVDERFMTVLYPERTSIDMPEMIIADVSNGRGIRINSPGIIDYSCLKDGDADLALTTDSGLLTSDAELLYVHGADGDSVADIFFVNGTYFAENGDIAASVSVSATMNVEFGNDDSIDGYIQTNQETTVTLYGVRPQSVTYRGDTIPFSDADEAVSFTVTGEGAWSVQKAVSLDPPTNVTKASVSTNHYYPETMFPGMNEYEVSLSVRGSDISSVTVEGPNVTLTSLEYEESTFGEWRWNISVGLPGKPSIGDTYVFHVTYNNSTTEDLTASVTGVIEEFPTIISPVHGSTITTTTPTFEWSASTIDLSQIIIIVMDSEEEKFIWMVNVSKEATSVVYNFDGEGEQLQSGKTYFWAVLYRDESDDNGAFVFSEFTIDAETITATISGNISYSGTSTGTIYVVAFTDPTFNEDEIAYVELSSLGSYTLPGLADGTYYVASIMTIDSDDDDDDVKMTDPWGVYGTWENPTSVTITGGSDVSGIDITLVDGTEENPNPFNEEEEKYSVRLWSSNWHYGESYIIDFKVWDPYHEATSVEVTGYGITDTFSLVYDNNEKVWRRPNDKILDFGSSPPTPPLTYTFTIVDPSATTVKTDTVESFVSVYATNLSPSGGETITGSLVFSWTWADPGYTYWVKLHDAEGNQVWSAYDLTEKSVVYDGPVLTSGAEYYYEVAVKDGYGNLSHAEESFVYQTTPAAPTNASVGTNHYYPETLFPGMDEYDLSLTVRGSDISSVTVEGPNVTLTSLEYEETLDSHEWRWTKHVGLPGKPSIGDTYVFHVTYNNSTTEDLTASVTGVIEEFPTIISPVHGSTITTTIPKFEWSALTIDVSQIGIMVTDLEAGILMWIGEVSKEATSVVYNFDGEGESLQPEKRYLWIILYRDESDDNGAMVFSVFTVDKEAGVEEDMNTALPFVFYLSQNYPNPFNPLTTISYQLPFSGQVSIKVYDIIGQEIATLVNEFKEPGEYTVIWTAEDMPSGLYFCTLKASGFTETRKMVLVE